MKKVFAIIAILVVLVGAVFADAPVPATGYATLKVVTLVTTFEPAFKLVSYKAGNIASTSGELIASQTERGVMATATNSDADATDAYHVIDVNTLIDDTETSTTVDFAVIQTIDSKSYKTYTLSATSTPLTMVKKYNNLGALVALGNNETPTVENHRVFAAEDATVSDFAAGSAIGVATNELTSGGSGSAFTVTYGGALVAANAQIATFSCSWTNDPEAVPGQYEADIVLHVTSN